MQIKDQFFLFQLNISNCINQEKKLLYILITVLLLLHAILVFSIFNF